ncbi:MAG: DoxX family protein [Pirellulales bacterium]|nr:DoxX family protein [Pirellulales bacterium]
MSQKVRLREVGRHLGRGEEILNSRPYTIGFLTVLAMVALRIVVGWHFFQEGLNHQRDPKWSSEGFLRAAKGPLAEFYHAKAPGPHGYYRTLLTPMNVAEADDALDRLQTEERKAAAAENADKASDDKSSRAVAKAAQSPIYGKWFEAILHDLGSRRDQIANHFGFSDEQKRQLDLLLSNYDKKLIVLLEGDRSHRGFADDIKRYRHELWRNQQMQQASGADQIPNMQTRNAKRAGSPAGELPPEQIESTPADWLGEVHALGEAFDMEALALRTDEQIKLDALPAPMTELKRMDTAVIWLLLIGGGCLVAGLFTRLSAIALALFLASVVLSQPFWAADAVKTTYFEWVELVALLVLATSRVGRWAGLDFFIHHVVLRPFRSA